MGSDTPRLTRLADVSRVRRELLSEQRKHRRVTIALKGRFLASDGTEHDCSVVDISPGGALLDAPFQPEAGTNVIVYLEELGRLEGPVVRKEEQRFAMQFRTTEAKRERLAEKLTFLLNKGSLKIEDMRRHERLEGGGTTKIVLQGGREVPCRVIDMSLSGLSLEVSLPAAEMPPKGEVITVGRMQARIVRIHAQGIAVEFLKMPLTPGALAERLQLANRG